jgi:hypothetical protein
MGGGGEGKKLETLHPQIKMEFVSVRLYVSTKTIYWFKLQFLLRIYRKI